MAFAGLLMVVLYLGIAGVAVYMLILLANFLKAGTEAFTAYTDDKKNRGE